MWLAWDEQVPNDIIKGFPSWTGNLVSLRELSLARSLVSISWKEKRSIVIVTRR